MNIASRITGVCMLMAGAAWGQGQQVMLMDDFADGVRNTAVWKPSRVYDGLFTERAGRLEYSCPSGLGMARMTARNGYQLLPGDILEFEALVSPGPLVSTSNAHLLEIGLGFRDQIPNPAKSCLVYLARIPTGLTVLVDVQAATSNTRNYVLPAGYSRYILTLRYNASTGKMSIFYRSVGSSFGVLLGTIPLNRWWGIPVGEGASLTPVLAATSITIPVGSADKAFVDSAVVTITAP